MNPPPDYVRQIESMPGASYRWLALDASSTAIGFAAYIGHPAAAPHCYEFGVLRRPKSWDAERRVDGMIGDLEAKDGDAPFAQVVIERTTGQTAAWLRKQGRHAVNPALAIAQGRVIQLFKSRHATVVCYGEREWTKGRGKRKRAAMLAQRHAAYRDYQAKGEDVGLDAADALGIGEFHIGKCREAEMVRRAEKARA